MEINGLPAHALIVHGAVVLAPLAALSTIAFAVLPKWRYLTRWPTALLALAATGAIWGARLTGGALKEKVNAGGPVKALIETHESRGQVLSLVMIAFLVLTLLGTWLLSSSSGLASGKGAVAAREPWVDSVVPVVLVVISVVALVWVVLTGDAGAKAVYYGV